VSSLASDLPGPVGAPSGPTEGESIVVTPQADAAASIVVNPDPVAPEPVASTGEVILALESPWYIKNFDPSIKGCPPITNTGTAVSASLADQAIATGASNGVTIVKR